MLAFPSFAIFSSTPWLLSILHWRRRRRRKDGDFWLHAVFCKWALGSGREKGARSVFQSFAMALVEKTLSSTGSENLCECDRICFPVDCDSLPSPLASIFCVSWLALHTLRFSVRSTDLAPPHSFLLPLYSPQPNLYGFTPTLHFAAAVFGCGGRRRKKEVGVKGRGENVFLSPDIFKNEQSKGPPL